ncbi:calmodulin [Chrysochromulina tobinii]|uniref:Calmodulin n=1 Tax=Chrysochromulina tobinii TaxID=1460289 RepID=A0A0M0LQJ9_9EUKA|nr:calmodulin [Chrysochromulina tobinii]|eukprot:KOO53319.1 calmodulin [Chrysochromulina sp. CCMP291]
MGLDKATVAVLEAALTDAVRASLPLLPFERPCFIGAYLLSQLEGSEPPVPESSDIKATREDLAALSRLLTQVVNSTRGMPGWPIQAVSDMLMQIPPEVAEVLLTTEAPEDAPEAPEDAPEAPEDAPEAPEDAPEPPEDASRPPPMPRRLSSTMSVTFKEEGADPLKYSMHRPGESFFKRGLSFLDARSRDGEKDSSYSGVSTPGERFTLKRRATLRMSIGSSSSPDAKVSQKDPLKMSFSDSMGKDKFDAFLAEAKAGGDKTEHIKAVATAAFEAYDKDGSGTIDKLELFNVLRELGQVPSGGNPKEKEDFLEKNFALADTNGDGVVDFDEFAEFYALTMDAIEQEQVARDAFQKYDVDGSNSLEKHELFHALLDLDLLPGMALGEKREYLEEQFAAADTNGDGIVDFGEFVAFYVAARRASLSSTGIHRRRARAAEAAKERIKRQAAYVEPWAVFGAARVGDVILVRGLWILERAGYVSKTRERRGVTVTTWHLPDNAAPAAPLPCRQEIEAEHTAAILPVDELEEIHAAFLEMVASSDGATGTIGRGAGTFQAVPVVLASYCWATDDAPDPNGRALRQIAAALAQEMPTYQAFGMRDVGVFIDWCSLYQETRQHTRTDEELERFLRAKNQMGVWFAHKHTTVYIVPDEEGTPADEGLLRVERGWPFFEEMVCRLFKDVPRNKPYKLPNGTFATAWQKIINTGVKVEDRVDDKKQLPPLSAPRFLLLMEEKTFRKEPDADPGFVARLYRKVIEDGFNGLTKLHYAHLDWHDAELCDLGATLEEVSCAHVHELDLSYNDFTASKGLEALSRAIEMGALSSLKVLNLSNCCALRYLPEGICELSELEVLIIDGCVGMSTLPKNIFKLSGLKEFRCKYCHMLGPEKLKGLPVTTKIVQH